MPIPRWIAARLPRTRRQCIVAGLCAVVLVAGLMLPQVRTQEMASTWWNLSWGCQRKITLNNLASVVDLKSSPIRVSLNGGTAVSEVGVIVTQITWSLPPKRRRRPYATARRSPKLMTSQCKCYYDTS